MSKVRLQGNDDKEPVDVSFKAACCSKTLKTMMNDLGYTEDEVNDPIPVHNVNDTILRKAMEWAEHHKDDAKQAEDDDDSEICTDDISPWDSEFLEKLDEGTLYELIFAANYLDMKGLLTLTCMHIGIILIKGKSTEEIRTMFNVENDFTEEEEELVRRENEYCEAN